jgi:hypothetical protein
MRTARARDVWFSKCGKKAVVRAPGRSVNLDGDGKRFRRNEGERVDIETDISLARRVRRMALDTFMTRRGNANKKYQRITRPKAKTLLCKRNQATASLDLSTLAHHSASASTSIA